MTRRFHFFGASMHPASAAIRSLVFIVLTGVSAQAKAQANDGEALEDPTVERVVQRIDELIATDWKSAGLVPTEQSGDEEFCRRVWLDLAGVAPAVAEIRSFLADQSLDKRSRLIDQILSSPLHARHMAARWLETLLEENANDPTGNSLLLEDWLRQQFQRNRPYDLFVADFMTAGGAENAGPAIFYTSLDLQPERIAAETSRIFLGLELQCAQCHDHPTDRWSQLDFWNFAAFFSQLERSESRMNQPMYLVDRSNRELTVPDSDQIATPRYPGVDQLPEPDFDNNRRRQLTVWMASRDNTFMIRTAVDRVWAHLMGVSLSAEQHTEVLDLLSQEFVQRRFDLRALYSIVARTQAYNRSSLVPPDTVSDLNSTETSADQNVLAPMKVKSLTARQYYDSLIRNVYRQPPVLAMNSTRAEDLMRLQRRIMFLARMRAPNVEPTEYPHGLVQSLGLLNGPEVGQVTGRESRGLVSALRANYLDDSQRIEILYLSTVSRFPRLDEQEILTASLSECDSETERADLFADLLWVLLNSTECMLCP